MASVKAGQFFLVENISSPILPCPLLSSPPRPYPLQQECQATRSSRIRSGRNAMPSNPAGIPSGRIQQEYRPAGIPSGRIQQEYRPAGLHPAGIPSDPAGLPSDPARANPARANPARANPARANPARARRIAQDRAKSCKAQNPTLPARSLSNAVSSGFWANPSPNPLRIQAFRARIHPFLWEEHRFLSWTWVVFRRHRFLGFQTVPQTTLSEAAVPTWLPRNGKPPSPQAYFPWCKEHLRIPKTTNLGRSLLVTVPGRQKVYLLKEISVGPWEGIPRERFYP